MPSQPLRTPGFIFIELETEKMSQYIDFLKKVAHFYLVRNEQDFALMESKVSQILLMNPNKLPENHPFYGKAKNEPQGVGIEIGIVVDNLDNAFNMAEKISQAGQWKISSPIIHRPWGVHDFRILSPDGYYFRFTESES